MTKYERPAPDSGTYTSKFVRVGLEIFVTEPGDIATSHGSLATSHGVSRDIDRLATQNPDDVDGGAIFVFNDEDLGHSITVYSDSMTLSLPRSSEAREKTIGEFSQQSPGFKVEADTSSLEIHS